MKKINMEPYEKPALLSCNLELQSCVLSLSGGNVGDDEWGEEGGSLIFE